MGMTRKLISATTIGAVDFRSDKERTARSARKAAKWAKRGAKAQRRAARR